MLQELLEQVKHQGGLVDRSAYQPAVTIQNRQVWEAAGEKTRQYWIGRGEKYLDYAWPRLTAEMYAEYEQTGSRVGFEVPYHQRRQAISTLLLAEGYENKGRFLPALCQGISHICDEPTWVLPAHYQDLRGDQKTPASQGWHVHGIDLFAAETGNMLAWILYVLQPVLPQQNAALVQRVSHELRQRMIEPYLTRTDFWWLGYNTSSPVGNWTTWCTSNCLGVILLMEPEPARRLQGLQKACFSLDRFITAFAKDGACDEGPMYWNFAGACLFDSLEMLYEASKGAFDVFHHPAIARIGTYITKVHIHGLCFVNFADCPPSIPVDAALVYRYGKRIGDASMQALGAQLYPVLEQRDPEKSIRLKMYRALMTLADEPALHAASARATQPRDVYFTQRQIVISRETSYPGQGLVVAVKGGHNEEGHNHNDVGNVVVYLDGQPVLIDVGMPQYSKQTFSAERYTIWAMQSAYHNVPLINNVMQRHGAEFRARQVHYHQDEQTVTFSLDIAGAYPAEAGVMAWERCCTFQRSEARLDIRDTFIFQQLQNAYELRYMTCFRPQVETAQRIGVPVRAGKTLILEVMPAATAITIQPIPLCDKLLMQAWGPTLYQIRIRYTGMPQRGECLTRISSEAREMRHADHE